MNNIKVDNSSIPYNMREEFIKPPYSFYAAGLTWILYGFIFPLFRWFDFIIVSCLAILVFIVINKITPTKKILVPVKDKPIVSGNSEVDSIIENGITYLKEIRQANTKISDPVLTSEILRMEKATDKIFRFIAKNPANAPQIRKFMNYYLPTLLKLLNSYIELKEQKISGDNIHRTLLRIEAILSTIADAFEKQLDNLYADEALDISTDITVLESILTQEGLTAKENSK